MKVTTLEKIIKILRAARIAAPVALAIIAALSASGTIVPNDGGKPGGDPIDDDPGPW